MMNLWSEFLSNMGETVSYNHLSMSVKRSPCRSSPHFDTHFTVCEAPVSGSTWNFLAMNRHLQSGGNSSQAAMAQGSEYEARITGPPTKATSHSQGDLRLPATRLRSPICTRDAREVPDDWRGATHHQEWQAGSLRAQRTEPMGKGKAG
jgi:hypothetical protein